MNSARDGAKDSRDSDEAVSDTPSIDLLNRRLAISSAPRMLTEYEIELLQSGAKEVAQVAGEYLASKRRGSEL